MKRLTTSPFNWPAHDTPTKLFLMLPPIRRGNPHQYAHQLVWGEIQCWSLLQNNSWMCHEWINSEWESSLELREKIFRCLWGAKKKAQRQEQNSSCSPVTKAYRFSVILSFQQQFHAFSLSFHSLGGFEARSFSFCWFCRVQCNSESKNESFFPQS